MLNKIKHLLIILSMFMILLTPVTLPIYTTGLGTLKVIPTLPGIEYVVSECLALNVSAAKPAIVLPGSSFAIEFRKEINVSEGFMYFISLENNKLRLNNFTVTVEKVSNVVVKIKIPEDVIPGLYDLFLVGSEKVYLPRSVWVINPGIYELKIAHISDMHFGTGFPDEIIGGYKRFSAYILANILGPDVILVTGDEADKAAEYEYVDSLSYRYVFGYSTPLFLTPGNHDYPLDNFIKYYGLNEWYRVIDNKFLLISLDTRDRGYPLEKSLKWLSNVLSKYKNVSIKIIIMHYPVFYWQGTLNLSYDSELIANPKEVPESPLSYYWGAKVNISKTFLKLVEDYNVTIVLAGHIHRDQYVRYNSVRTNTTTYFITSTTSAQSRPNYNGLTFFKIHVNGTLKFPFKVSTFKGFADINRARVFNAIPIDPTLKDEYFFGEFAEFKNSYYFKLINKLKNLGKEFNINTTLLLALPWNGTFVNLTKISGDGSVYIIDKIIVNNILYVALRIELPYGTHVEFLIYNNPDIFPPNIEFALSIPKVPTTGKLNKLYINVFDDEWGLLNVSARLIINNKVISKKLEIYMPGTYVISARIPKSANILEGIIEVKACDFANNCVARNLTVRFYPPTVKPEELRKVNVDFILELEGIKELAPFAKIKISSDKVLLHIPINARKMRVKLIEGTYNITLVPKEGISADLATPYSFIAWIYQEQIFEEPSITLNITKDTELTLKVYVGEKPTLTPTPSPTPTLTPTPTPTPTPTETTPSPTPSPTPTPTPTPSPTPPPSPTPTETPTTPTTTPTPPPSPSPTPKPVLEPIIVALLAIVIVVVVIVLIKFIKR